MAIKRNPYEVYIIARGFVKAEAIGDKDLSQFADSP